MPKIVLTADIVDRARPTSRLVELVDMHPKASGLTLRISPSGAKSWSTRFRLAESGERRRIQLGRYPAVSLSIAREKALEVHGKAAKDIDPAKERKAKRAAAEKAKLETLAVLAERYFEAAAKGRHRRNGKPKRDSALKLERYYWLKHVEPAFGKKSVHEIRRGDIQAAVDKAKPSTGRQMRALLQRLFTYGRWLEILDHDPSHFVETDAWESRDRVLSQVELRALWQVLDDPARRIEAKINGGLATAIKLCALTLQRRGEVAGIALAEIDLVARVWVLPGARTKNKRTHVVPLSDEAIKLIQSAIARLPKDATHLFPAARGAAKTIQAATVTRAFIEAAKAAKVTNARLHDLRRSGATSLTSERLGFGRFTVSAILNHASDSGDAASVTAVYDRNDHLPQKRAALDAWAKELLRIAEDRPIESTNIVPIRGRAG
jgi:integrase